MVASFKEASLQTFLEKIAREQGFEHAKFSIVSATKPGENFVGRLFRVSVTEENCDKSLSLIIKASSSNRARRKLISSDILFKTECEMYGTILPALNSLLQKQGFSNSATFPGTARCFGCHLKDGSTEDDADAIALEDKGVDGFGIVEVKVGLDEIQCRMALEKLALLHGACMALRVLEPQTADRFRKLFDKGLWKDENDPVVLDLKQGLLIGLDLLGKPLVKGNPVYERIYKIYENFHECMLTWVSSTDVSCISHGDFWSNNVLFKFNEDGVAEDACVIDFQLASTSSPATDVTCLLLMCTAKELRDDHYEDLLRFYHDELSKTLSGLGCDPKAVFSWDHFQNHLRSYGVLGAVAAIMSLPVLMAEKSEIKTDVHLDNDIFTGTAKITDPQNLKQLKKRLNDVVTDAVRWGYL